MGSICHHIYFIQNSSVYTTKYQQIYIFFSGYLQDLTEQYLATLIIIKKIPFFLDMKTFLIIIFLLFKTRVTFKWKWL
jgi:hypothetical protein